MIINKELQNVYEWLCANKLSLNIDKTKYKIFHSAHKNIDHDTFNIKLNNISIENVKSFNFLGITLNENLNWNQHTSQISLKLSRNIGLLGKLEHFLPGYILKILYNTI